MSKDDRELIEELRNGDDLASRMEAATRLEALQAQPSGEAGRLREAVENAIAGIEAGNLYEPICCGGGGQNPENYCGCRGSSNADLLIYHLREALTASPPVVEREDDAAQRLQDHMEQHHGVCLPASAWDVANLALTPVEGVGERRAYSPGEVVAEAEAIWNDALWHFNPDWKEADGFEGSRDRAIKSISTALIMHDNYRALSTPVAQGDEVRDAIRAAHAIFEQATDFYTARNGRRMSIEGDDGEKCWIVPFEVFEELRHALATLTKGARDAG